MEERAKILLANAIDYIYEQYIQFASYNVISEEIAKNILGMTPEEFSEVKEYLNEEQENAI